MPLLESLRARALACGNEPRGLRRRPRVVVRGRRCSQRRSGPQSTTHACSTPAGSRASEPHRQHEIVNFEKAYSNLRRLLLGNLEVTAESGGLWVRSAANDEIMWQLEIERSIRGLPILMHEQPSAHHYSIQVESRRDEDGADRPVPLLTMMLGITAPPDGRAKQRPPSAEAAPCYASSAHFVRGQG